MFRAHTKIALLPGVLLASLALALLAMAATVKFGAPQQYLVQRGPTGIAVADLNGDHKVDLVIPNLVSGAISMLLGNGDGTFSPANNYQIIDDGGNTAGIVAVAAADFDHDGKIDVAVVNSNRKTVDILMGNGNGTFGRGATIPFPDTPFAIVAGDFNGDGKPDLAVTSVESFDYKAPGKLTILLGNGNGTFAPQSPIVLVAANPYSMAAADFDEDKTLDLVVTSPDNSRS
jgi:hypothetical protein